MVEDGYDRVESPMEVEALLEALMAPGGASLQVEDAGGEPLPVLVEDHRPGEELQLDISAIREIAGTLQRGQPFRLLGRSHGKMVRTSTLTMQSCQDEEGRLVCRSDYPRSLEVLQRRETFRAQLRLGMEVGAILRNTEAGGRSIQGDLKDLSLEGCRLELPLSASGLLGEGAVPLEVELCFPDGTRYVISRASLRHRNADMVRRVVQAGFRFEQEGAEQERKLWYFVRAIEQEAARHVEGADASRQPSPLFLASVTASPTIGRRNMCRYATPMAKRLSRVAGYLDAQILELHQGGEVSSVQLSRHADLLLLLHEEDREALLFATHCLHEEARLVRHCVSVAVHLLDLLQEVSPPHELCKAVVASAMLHDLGKALLPADLWELATPSTEDKQRMREHVDILQPRMRHCHWLASAVHTSVVQRINERLDGNGYPQGLGGETLGELERAAAVVDVVDAMRRDRADRPAWRLQEVISHLLTHSDAFDARWVRRYFQRFGRYPIGSLVRFSSDTLGWVQGLDDSGAIARVQLTDTAGPPTEEMGKVIQGDVSQRLGEVVEEVVVNG
ncbi:PilZ domain-containing protein [Halomonas sabkhae]|uniref:HD domain-containing phosphohydrolase n=1 Tax=Halomonas sabkhae TaxID=626223 RepID=UPI0025B40FC0|nr:HD domain-containing phosphohydrolase [Halomonas sabkhae]MDN3524865.1 PilZ domain-containing protein [Halomonas sabkhae]